MQQIEKISVFAAVKNKISLDFMLFPLYIELIFLMPLNRTDLTMYYYFVLIAITKHLVDKISWKSSLKSDIIHQLIKSARFSNLT